MCGGEYLDTNQDGIDDSFAVKLANSGECEAFDPSSNTWSVLPSMPGPVFDTPSAHLADGRILVIQRCTSDCSASSPTTWLFGEQDTANPWRRAADHDSFGLAEEGGALLLPDGSVFSGLRSFARYLPESDRWVATKATPGNAVDEFVSLPAGSSEEIGPFLLLQKGPIGPGSSQVLVLGGNSLNGMYTPPDAADPTGLGNWLPVAPTPAVAVMSGNVSINVLQNHGDSPAAVEPGGSVFTVVTADADGTGGGEPVFYEYQTAHDLWVKIPYPIQDNGASAGPPGPQSALVRLLVLPTGQLLVSGWSDGSIWLYTPNPSVRPDPSWLPTITGVSPRIFGQYRVSGLQLNGISTGAYLGDEAQLSTTYPLAFATDPFGKIIPLRTRSFDSMAPNPGGAGGFFFSFPNSTPGIYTIAVTTNGLPAIGSGQAAFQIFPRVLDIGPALLPVLFGGG